MTTCRYCEHSEARDIRLTGLIPYKTELHCLRHNATVQRDDTCPDWERSPGVDDDLGDGDEL